MNAHFCSASRIGRKLKLPGTLVTRLCPVTISGIFILLHLLAAPAGAQPQGKARAHSGPRGIWVDLGTRILPASIDGKTYNAYKVERRERGARNWTEIATVSGPATQLELDLALQSQYYHFPEMRTVKINAPELWRSIEQTRDVASAKTAGLMLPVQAALGVRWHDSTAQRGKIYEYRVSSMAADGSAAGESVTPSLSYPQPVSIAALTTYSTDADASTAEIVWRAGRGDKPATFEIYRREGISGPFLPLQLNLRDSCCIVSANLILRQDTIFCSVFDRTIKAGAVYQYYIKPTDFFRNPGRESDTATVLTFNMAHVPLPQRMKARSVDTAGLQLRWTLLDTSAVHGIIIERSIDFDTGYVRLFTAAPTDTSFIDVTVKPMDRYYYRLRLVGPGGIMSPPSATIMGHFQSSTVPPPPSGITATGIPGGIRISWVGGDNELLEGYYVYRAEGTGDEMRLISALLPPETAGYTDTLGLQGGYTYAYCVQAMSTSHVPGFFSDTATAQAIAPVEVSTPMALRAQVDDKRVYLFWDGQGNHNAGLDGFRVFRREEGAARWSPLTDTLLHAWQNNFQDDRVTPGRQHTYAVRAYSIAGDSSALSAPATAYIPLPSLYPPANLKARIEKKKVVLSWDEVLQPDATGFKLYRYTRGAKPSLVAALKLDDAEYTDSKPGAVSPVFYYLTTVGKHGVESRPGAEAAVVLAK